MKTHEHSKDKLDDTIGYIRVSGIYYDALEHIKKENDKITWRDIRVSEDNNRISYSLTGSIEPAIRMDINYSIEPVHAGEHWYVLYRAYASADRIVGVNSTSGGLYVRQLSPSKLLILLFTTEKENQEEKEAAVHSKEKEEDEEVQKFLNPPSEEEFLTAEFQNNTAAFLAKTVMDSLPKTEEDELWNKPEFLISTTETIRYHLLPAGYRKKD